MKIDGRGFRKSSSCERFSFLGIDWKGWVFKNVQKIFGSAALSGAQLL
jgi:hypothetical protein